LPRSPKSPTDTSAEKASERRAGRAPGAKLATPPAVAPQAPTAPAQLPHGAAGLGRIFLIDSMSFIFRAYHAMVRQRPMSTRTGIPTAATYVFVNMLQKLRKDFAPEYIAAVFDVAAVTFRDTRAAEVATVRKFDIKTQQFQEVAYGGYKANRAAMPPDLAQQIPYIRRALEAYRIPIIEFPGFEADDVIGTMARLAAEQNYPVYIVSSDKDMLQLVNERVCVLNPPKDNLICDRAKVEEILGVPPERVVDVMALRGDSIDNIPGAPGIGDKGSVELIRRFGSVEAALDHAAEVEKKTYRESLLNNRDAVLFSKEMVTVDCNVPGVELNVERMTAREPDADAARDLFTELEFTTLAKDFAPTVELGETDYAEAKSAADVAAELRGVTAQAPLAFALEPAGGVALAGDSPEDEAELQAEAGTLPLIPPSLAAAPAVSQGAKLAISARAGRAREIALDHARVDAGDSPASALKRVLADSTMPKSTHDLKAAIRALAGRDLTVAGVTDDGLLFSYLLDPTHTSHALEAVALRRFNLKLSGSVAERADITGRLAAALRKEVDEAGLRRVYDDIDLPLVPVLARMEAAGVKIDCDVLERMSSRLEREIAAKAREIYDLAAIEFNINSPRQLGDVLFNKLALPKPIKYGKGKTISTAADVLNELAEEHEVPRLVLEYRELSKLKSTYVDALPVLCHEQTGRLHTTFNQAGTATGRLSSTNPNLQNIPIRTELGREIRAAFTAERGHLLLKADYSQIELRLLAHFSQDALMLDAFAHDRDFHRATAAEVFGLMPEMVTPEIRNRAKAINFGIPYGLSGFGLAQQLGIDKKEAQAYIDAYFAKYTGVKAWLDATKEQARRDGVVRTLFGRVRPIPDINSKNFNSRGFAERTAVNTPLQGTAADLIKLAMIRIDAELRRRELRSQMTLQVHDELVFEVPEAEVETLRQLVRDIMENVYTLTVPLVADVGVGLNWRDLE
jgi:DNA polymerase-1